MRSRPASIAAATLAIVLAWGTPVAARSQTAVAQTTWTPGDLPRAAG